MPFSSPSVQREGRSRPQRLLKLNEGCGRRLCITPSCAHCCNTFSSTGGPGPWITRLLRTTSSLARESRGLVPTTQRCTRPRWECITPLPSRKATSHCKQYSCLQIQSEERNGAPLHWTRGVAHSFRVQVPSRLIRQHMIVQAWWCKNAFMFQSVGNQKHTCLVTDFRFSFSRGQRSFPTATYGVRHND